MLYRYVFYPYDHHRIQSRQHRKHDSRVQVYEWLQLWLNTISETLFTEDAKFTGNIIAKTTNLLSWPQKNPHKVEHFILNTDTLTCGLE
jgi:hypothetical protein